jgi:hypothetical protein
MALEMKVIIFRFASTQGGGCIHNNVAMLDLASGSCQPFTANHKRLAAKWDLWNRVEVNFQALKRAEFEAQVL